MTCNPRWPEIEDSLLFGQRAGDSPDLCNRVFRMKQKILVTHLKEDQPFGRIVADVSVIEFQKRGLVHANIILFLDEEAKRALEIRNELIQLYQLKFLLKTTLSFAKLLSST